jgi:hypothetical protein
MQSIILRRGILALALALLVLLTGSRQARVFSQGAGDIILLASSARLAGAWRVMSTSGAAGGTATVLPNTNRAKVVTPLANPADYFELTFTVNTNVP